MPLSEQQIEKAFEEALLDNPYLHHDHFIGKYTTSERFWVHLQPFLLHRGYRLRPRYQPNFVAPWLIGDKVDEPHKYEEAMTLGNGAALLDAVQVSDGTRVVLKRTATWRDEVTIAQYLTSPTLRTDVRNHTVPILDILLLPDDDNIALLVMPQLLPFDHLPFRRMGELIDALSQYVEGLAFLHEHRIAHKDACFGNLMVDGSKLVPRGVHFMQPDSHDGLTLGKLEWKDRSTVGPLQYYFIDFGLSTLFPPGQKFEAIGVYGQDRTVPEQQREESHNPFKVDIYQLGNVIMKMIRIYEGVEPLLKVATAMTRQKPEDRLSLEEASKWLNRISKRVRQRRIWRQTCPIDVRISVRFCSGSTKTYL